MQNFMQIVYCVLILSALIVGPAGAGAGDGWDKLKLWYDKPAVQWVEALPVGNGRLGAMVFGGSEKERLQLNEDTLWNGQPNDYAHEGAVKFLPEIRQLLFDGKQKEAEALAGKEFMSIPLRQKAYQPLGDLNLIFGGHGAAQNYRRELDLDTAVATVSYDIDGVSYRREVFASNPDQVLVVHVSASKGGKISFDAQLTSPHKDSVVRKAGDDQIAIAGQVTEGVLKYEARLLVKAEGGEVKVTDAGAEIRNADSATLLLAAASSYRNYKDVGADPAELCAGYIKSVAGRNYADISKDHLADYRGLFRRVSLDLGSSSGDSVPTDQRIKGFADKDPELAVLYFQFGRYMMISGSRPGSQPLNLQGIWNESLKPPWDSKYTVNINTEMNYWPAEVCNLAECHLPLFDMLEDVAVTGTRVAKEHYNCRGWVLHHNTDLWRGAAPINASNHGIWVTGGAWLCQHFWWHYQYSCDEEFLRKRAYPIMKGAAQFFVDFLIKDPKTGWLISTPSNSPEQGGLVAGPTMDHQIIRNLLGNCIEASEILGVDEDFRNQLRGIIKQIAPNQVGQHGQLQEWLEDKDNPKNQHRHTSHLWGLHPGSEITARGTPAIYDAAKTSLIQRGDGGTGWSKAWKINFWARFADGNHAYMMLSSLIRTGTYPNMFDSCPPFQIDGNFGAAAGIAEMLLQSHEGEINVLPALPDAWPAGCVKGLRARGGFDVNLSWQAGKLERAEITSRCGNKCRVRCGDKVVDVPTEKGSVYVLDGELKLK